MARHILLVDDDTAFRELMSEQLRSAGYQVSSVRKAREADVVLTATRIDLAIVDGFLPDGDGESWIAIQRKAGNMMPMIFVSGFAAYAKDRETHQRLTRDLRVPHVLPKPIDPRTLRSHVDKLLAIDRISPTLSKLTEMRKTYGSELTSKLAVIATSIALARSMRSPSPLAEARRLAHTLEGTAGSYGFTAVGHAAARVFVVLGGQVPQWDAIDASLAELRARVESAQSTL